MGKWSSIPLNEGRRQALELTLGGGAQTQRLLYLKSHLTFRREALSGEPVRK